MAQTLERLIRRTDTMQSIRGIVRTMKTMSAINAAPYEQAARSIDAWRDTVLDALHAFLHRHGPLIQDRPRGMKDVIVVMGSDHGLCGNYNELLAAEAARHVAPDGSTRMVCVGAQMQDALSGEHMVPEAVMLPPANADGLNRLAGELVTWLEPIRVEAGAYDIAVMLVYTQRGLHGRQGPVSQVLLPLDTGLLDELARRPWPARSLPQFSLPAPVLLAALIRNFLFATLYRACAEALVTENAARLARMSQAEQSVDEKLEELRGETRQVRQSEITTELLDVIVGFEAIRARDRRRRAGEEADR